ncbi:MAG: DNA starvation/stationary phase protection protein [Alphaproteobacteria bacterium]|nr:DNA starvation/stationary phase protection protein [Alphaproteobacteria bacterium]
MADYYKNEDTRDIINSLKVYLANTTIVYYKTHEFHWNVEGASFYTLHIMFEKFYIKLWKSMDETAERIRALGEKVPPSLAELLPQATILENETAPQSQVMAQILRNDYYALAENALKIAALATEKNDLITADMMIQRATFLEKAAWMLYSTIKD